MLINKRSLLLSIATTIAVFVLLFWSFGEINRLSYSFFHPNLLRENDHLNKITVVQINDDDCNGHCDFHQYIADLVNYVSQFGPSVIAIDYFFDNSTTPDSDYNLIASFKSAANNGINVVVTALGTDEGGSLGRTPFFYKELKGIKVGYSDYLNNAFSEGKLFAYSVKTADIPINSRSISDILEYIPPFYEAVADSFPGTRDHLYRHEYDINAASFVIYDESAFISLSGREALRASSSFYRNKIVLLETAGKADGFLCPSFFSFGRTCNSATLNANAISASLGLEGSSIYQLSAAENFAIIFAISLLISSSPSRKYSTILALFFSFSAMFAYIFFSVYSYIFCIMAASTISTLSNGWLLRYRKKNIPSQTLK